MAGRSAQQVATQRESEEMQGEGQETSGLWPSTQRQP